MTDTATDYPRESIRYPKADIMIEFDDGTVASCQIDDDLAETVSIVIEALMGQKMNLKT